MNELRTEVSEVRVSDRINTFLLLSLNKKKRNFRFKNQVRIIEDLICNEFIKWQTKYKEKLIKLYNFDPIVDKQRIDYLQNRKLHFLFINNEGIRISNKNMNGKDSTTCDTFSSCLAGRHDYVYLLEAPNLIEMSSMINEINLRLEKKFVRESQNISCIPMDFAVGEDYFIGGSDKCWFAGEAGDTPKWIELRDDWVYAIACVELKKGMKRNGSFLEMQDFLSPLIRLRNQSKKCILGIFAGLGLHELIFVLGSSRISEIILSVADLREKYLVGKNESMLRDTSTIFCEPKREPDMDMDCQEDIPMEYSVLLSTIPGTDQRILEELDKDEIKVKIRNWTQDGIKIYERQGYFDLIVSFKSESLFHALQLSTILYETDNVLTTSTIVKMEENDVMEGSKKRE